MTNLIMILSLVALASLVADNIELHRQNAKLQQSIPDLIDTLNDLIQVFYDTIDKKGANDEQA